MKISILLFNQHFKSQSFTSEYTMRVVKIEDMGDYNIHHCNMIDNVTGDSIPNVSCYTKDGAYIGDLQFTKMLVDKYGIVPERANPDSEVCSIGYSKKDGKFYGWSHRAMYGFKPGDRVKKGDCAYFPPKDREEILQHIRNFWDCDTDYHNIIKLDGENVVHYSPNYKRLRKKYGDGFFHKWRKRDWIDNFGHDDQQTIWQDLKDSRYMIKEIKPLSEFKTGRGEWTAKTKDDAKQMAIDFAMSVSKALKRENENSN